MSAPEIGKCSLEDYEKGKEFIVTPDRLCVEGLYVCALKARPNRGWEAWQFAALVKEIKKPATRDGKYLGVSAELENPKRTAQYRFDVHGYICNLSVGSAGEGYFRHQNGDIEDELDEIVTGTILNPKEVEDPELVPTPS